MKSLLFVIALIAIVAVLSSTSGCSSNIRDESLTQDCKVSRLDASTGIVNSNDQVEICGLECTDKLLKGHFIEVSDPRSGCKAGVGP